MTTKVPVELSSTPGIVDGSNATAITIDSSENVGIGETSPLGKIHAKVSDTGASASAQGNLLVLEDTENGLSILSSTSGAGYINFGDSDDNDIGMIIYDHSANAMRFWANAAERMRIDTNGNVGIGTTAPSRIFDVENSSASALCSIVSGTALKAGFVFGDTSADDQGGIIYENNGDYLYFRTGGAERLRILNGGGLTFNGDTAAANALDDYEEGTWTPAAGPGSSITYSYNSGNYTKVGRLVTAYFGFLLSGGTFTSSEATISGLPFAVQTTGSYQEPQFVIYTYGAGPTGITGAVGPSNSLIPGQLSFYLNGGESQGRGRKFTTNADAQLPANEAFDSNTFVKGVVIYYTS